MFKAALGVVEKVPVLFKWINLVTALTTFSRCDAVNCVFSFKSLGFKWGRLWRLISMMFVFTESIYFHSVLSRDYEFL